MNRIYYTYYSYEIDKGINGLGYIGVRLCPKGKTPETDLYYGTPTSPKNLAFKENTQKGRIILGVFDNKDEAYEHEIYLHNLWDVDKNSHFANQAKQTSKGFSYCASGVNNPTYGRPANEMGSYDHTLRDWYNEETNIFEFQITNYDLYTKYDIDTCHLCRIAKGIRRAHAGWTLELPTKKNWINLHSGKVELDLTNHELKQKYPEINYRQLAMAVSGRRTHHYGWAVKPPD